MYPQFSRSVARGFGEQFLSEIDQDKDGVSCLCEMLFLAFSVRVTFLKIGSHLIDGIVMSYITLIHCLYFSIYRTYALKNHDQITKKRAAFDEHGLHLYFDEIYYFLNLSLYFDFFFYK
jgi:hypothetical protein